MKIGVGQINPTVGDVQKNEARILETLAKATQAKVPLVVFPELCLTGYPPRDLLDYPHFVEKNLRALKRIADSCKEVTVVCGYVEQNPAHTGRPYFNAAAVIQGGKITKRYFKHLLPYYDVFDEPRYFERGTEVATFSINGEKIAVTICEDLWNRSPLIQRPYTVDFLTKVQHEKPSLVINLSASPFHLGKPAHRVTTFSDVARTLKCPVILVNQMGANDHLIFDGCSIHVGATGELIESAPAFEEGLFIFDTTRTHSSCSWPTQDESWLWRALEIGIRDYVNKSELSKVCLGLSGGVDSSVVAALAVSALGTSRVTGISLPSPYTSSMSQEDARALAKNLGISFFEFPIDKLFEYSLSEFHSAFGSSLEGVAKENLQPRLRMVVLMAYSNAMQAILLNTSNKSEVATGYTTLYGDSAGALSVLGDLTKHQVYQLAHFANQKVRVIPERVMSRPPSAELHENQRDEDTLPPYPILDELVVDFVEKSSALTGRQVDAVQKFQRLYQGSEYKRWQFPPILRVSNRAFGIGRRIPIVGKRDSCCLE